MDEASAVEQDIGCRARKCSSNRHIVAHVQQQGGDGGRLGRQAGQRRLVDIGGGDGRSLTRKRERSCLSDTRACRGHEGALA